MGRNRTLIDVDHVPTDPKPLKSTRKPPPEPWELPTYTPLPIAPLTHGHSNLPPHISPDQPYDIFSLFFDDETLQILADNTNEYADRCYVAEKKPYARRWLPTNIKELQAYIGTYIYMGVHRETAVKDYWNENPKNPIHDAVVQGISETRWEQIDRFFYISKPLHPLMERETPFEKLEPLSEHLRQTFKSYWKTGTHLAVDETIQRFMGRAQETVNIPSKPEPEGFKIWVLANQGYVLDWLYHAKGDVNGPVDLDDFWTDHKGFTKTQAVVLDLATQEGISTEYAHVIWLDNLFTSARLLSALKAEGFGAAGTVRTQKTRREVLEETSGTKEQKKELAKEKNRGLLPSLSDLKLIYGGQLDWGKLYGGISDDGNVLEFA